MSTRVYRLACLLVTGVCLTWQTACAADDAANDASNDVSNDAGAAEEADTRVSIKAEAPVTFRDACEVLTAGDVAAIYGSPVEARSHVETLGETQCEYGPADGFPVMEFVIQWRGGKDQWEAMGMGRSLATRMMGESEMDSTIVGNPLSDLGDAAHYGGVMPSFVLVDDVILEFYMHLIDDPRANFPVLARKALARL